MEKEGGNVGGLVEEGSVDSGKIKRRKERVLVRKARLV